MTQATPRRGSALGGSANPPSLLVPKNPGGRIVGTIVEILADRQATKFQNPAQRAAKAPRELDFHQNGDPKMTTPVVLQLDPGFPALNTSDTGLRTLYVTEGDPRSKAFRRHAKATRVTAAVGYRLEMLFVGKEQGQGDNPMHVWKVEVLEPAPQASALGGYDDEDDDDERGTLAATGTEAPTPTPTVPTARRTRRPAASVG